MALALALMGMLAPSAGAVSLQSIGAYSDPVFITSDPSNPDRLFVVERAGKIELTTQEGTSTFLDITSIVESGYQERGLLSMAFAPDFASSGLFYVYYTSKGDGTIHVAELHASGDNADSRSIRDVITIPHPSFPNHNGGQLQFGPDGYLYLATGDGGSGGDPPGNAQNLNVLLGKMLRIDPRQNGAQAYTVPPDNPFVGVVGTRSEIWSYGLRNPYRFSFDRSTGALTIGDVGQGAREEIDYALQPNAGRGVNFGWNCREGLIAYPDPAATCSGRSFTEPVHDYPHSGRDPDDQGCAITGGYIVRDPGLTELAGRYVYGDYCTGILRSAVLGLPAATDDRSEGVNVGSPSSFGEDSCGRVYVASLSGTVSRLVDSTPTDCGTPPPAGGPCAQVVDGTKGRDTLAGGPGAQRIRGHSGDDRIKGGSGDDCVNGDGGADHVNGGAGADRIVGGAGRDSLNSADGERDTVLCGKGEDSARVDRIDTVRGCERTRHPN
jgi:hypothetical protein